VFYIIEQGDVGVQIEGSKTKKLGRGSYFGELALLYDQPRSATVVALSDCVLWGLER
jgi:CRP-like cAMP-binding protein